MRRKGLKKAKLGEDFAEAMKEGLHYRDMKGSMKREISYKMMQHDSNCVYYQNMLYFFNSRTGNLKTVVPLPSRYRKYLK